MDASNRTPRAEAPRSRPSPTPAATGARKPGGPTVQSWLMAFAGFGVGALCAYLLASYQFNEQTAAIRQAGELRVTAANQRIQELQEQQRQFARQMDQKTQEIVADADAQQRQIVHQLSQKEQSLLAQQDAKERVLLAQQQALLEQERARVRDLAKPDLPIKVWAHKPPSGPGLVAQVHNFGNTELVVAVTSHGAGSAAQGTWRGVLAPNSSQLVGKDGGWTLIAGDVLELQADGFRPMSFTVAAGARPPQRTGR